MRLHLSNLKNQLNVFESTESIWLNWIILKWLNLFETIFKLIDYKVPRTRTRTTIFKLLGPCESLSRSKKTLSGNCIFFPNSSRCLKIPEKVPFYNNALRATFASLKMPKMVNLVSFWRLESCGQTVIPDRSISA